MAAAPYIVLPFKCELMATFDMVWSTDMVYKTNKTDADQMNHKIKRSQNKKREAGKGK